MIIAGLFLCLSALGLKAEEYTYGGVVYRIEDGSTEALALRYDDTSETVLIVDRFTYHDTSYEVIYDSDHKDIFTGKNRILKVDASGTHRLDPEIKFSDCQFLRTVVPSEDWRIGDYQFFNCPMLDLKTVLTPTLQGVGQYALAMESPWNLGELFNVDISMITETCMHNRIYSVIELKTALTEDGPASILYNCGLKYLDLSGVESLILDGYSGTDVFSYELNFPRLRALAIFNGDLRVDYGTPLPEYITLGGVITELGLDYCDISKTTFNYEDVEVVNRFGCSDIPIESLDLNGKVRDLCLSNLSKLKTLTGCEGVTDVSLSSCRLLESASFPDVENFNGAYECKNLKEIYLGASLSTMEQRWTFDRSDNLEDLIYGGSIEQWLAVMRIGAEDEHPKDAPLSKVKNFWYGHGNAKISKLTELNSDNIGNATVIGPEAFTAYAGLTKIDLPASVKVIGPTSFALCTNLEYVRINAEQIDQYAFLFVENIKDFIIGDNLKYIGPAFTEITNPVTMVNYMGTPSEWAEIERSLTVYLDPYDPEAGVGNIVRGTYIVPTKEMLFMGQPLVTLELNDPKVISPGSFANIKSLTSIKINGQTTPTLFDDKSFYGCSNLKNIEISASAPSRAGAEEAEGYVIRSQAFAGCSALEEIPMLDNLKSIASDALNETGWFKKQPSNSVVYLNTEYGRTAYTYNGTPAENSTLTIEDGAEAINDQAFATEKYANFRSVSLPGTLKYIGTNALDGIDFDNANLTIPASVETIKSNSFSHSINCLKFEDSKTPIEVDECELGYVTSLYFGRDFTEASKRLKYRGYGFTTLEKIEYGKEVTNINNGNGIPLWAAWNNENLDIYSYSPVPPECDLSNGQPTGLEVNKETCVLYVPTESLETYRSAPGWSEFLNIRPFDPSGIDKIAIDIDNSTARHYDVSGRPIQPTAKGIHIIVNADGSTGKLLVK